VVASARADGVTAARWLLVEDCDQRGAGRNDHLVALDLVGADRGQLVLLAQGSSCRWDRLTEDRPIDAVVLAIVDQIDEQGEVVFPSAGASHG
jgi:microcompartment protein CcmK/EutM